MLLFFGCFLCGFVCLVMFVCGVFFLGCFLYFVCVCVCVCVGGGGVVKIFSHSELWSPLRYCDMIRRAY